MVERGEITSNKIELTDGLIATFKRLWMQYVGDSDTFKPNIALPLWHMQSEPFWRLIGNNGTMFFKEDIQGNPYSVVNLRKQIKHAEINMDLFELLQSGNVCKELKAVILMKTKITV